MFTVSHDYYGILGVSKNATPEEIKVQYRKLIRKHHPDQFKGLRAKYQDKGDEDLLKVIDEKIREADEKCKLINEAFEVLSDPIKRKQYDEQVIEPSVPLPEISIHPTRIAFGSLYEGQNKSLTFTIENKGGPPAAVNIDWERDKPDWGELVIEPDTEKVFPIKVTVKVDTTGIPSGPKDEKILVDVDGRIHMIEVFLAVTSAVVAPATGARPPTPPTKTRFTPRPSLRSEILGRVIFALVIIAATVFALVVYDANQRSRARERSQQAWATQTAIVQKQFQEQQLQQQEEQQRKIQQTRLIQETSQLVSVDDVRRIKCWYVDDYYYGPDYRCIRFMVTNNSDVTVAIDTVLIDNNVPRGIPGSFFVPIEPGQAKEFVMLDNSCEARNDMKLVPDKDYGFSTIASQLCLKFNIKVKGFGNDIPLVTICRDIPNVLRIQ